MTIVRRALATAMRSPSSAMRSRSGSARVPSARTTMPFTVTRPPGGLLAPDDARQPPLDERGQHRLDIHTAHGLDLETGARLAVGDDGERLEHRAREPRRPLVQQPAHPRAVLRRRAELPAARHL